MERSSGFRAIFIITFHSSQQWANILIESIITLISFLVALIAVLDWGEEKINGRYFVMSPKEACGKKNLVFEKTLMLRSF